MYEAFLSNSMKSLQGVESVRESPKDIRTLSFGESTAKTRSEPFDVIKHI
jgi:hypothetical protein